MVDEHTKQDDQGTVIKTSVSLPPYLFDWLKEVSKQKRFQSQSSVMVVALAELKGRMEEREEVAHAAKQPIPETHPQKPPETPLDILALMLQTQEGRQAYEKITARPGLLSVESPDEAHSDSTVLFPGTPSKNRKARFD